MESVHNQEQQSTAVVNYGGTNPRETTVQTTRVVLRPSPIDLVRRQASENTISSEIRNGTSVKNVKTRPQNTQRESQSNRNSRRIAGLPSKLRDYRFLQGLRLMAGICRLHALIEYTPSRKALLTTLLGIGTYFDGILKNTESQYLVDQNVYDP